MFGRAGDAVLQDPPVSERLSTPPSLRPLQSVERHPMIGACPSPTFR
jgi:hypothetical protein